MRRLIAAAILLYPRQVRSRHGSELGCLAEELIDRDGAAAAAVVARLAADGVGQRLRSRTTLVVMAITLAGSSVGGLAVSDIAAASSPAPAPLRAHHVQHQHRPLRRADRTPADRAGIIAP
ncbi:hypothetical protein [Conexibacter sp. DBS9H8]|uniref:hypothetical protein n=1 Tax=Conexibacter sp. DBS9H8 TaxID=2937801 RepID=UPI00200C0370|nr:hypothetical protein [Conexibacter sp. DBS9H8]